jgi:hypothetical protein
MIFFGSAGCQRQPTPLQRVALRRGLKKTVKKERLKNTGQSRPHATNELNFHQDDRKEM